MRVPAGPRACIRICPESTVGKEILTDEPDKTKRTRPRHIMNAARHQPAVLKRPVQQSHIAEAQALEQPLNM